MNFDETISYILRCYFYGSSTHHHFLLQMSFFYQYAQNYTENMLDDDGDHLMLNCIK